MTGQLEQLPSDAAPADIVAVLARDGGAAFCGIHERARVVALASRVMAPWRHRDADPDCVTLITDRGALAERPGMAGFGFRALPAHTDASALRCPPRLLLMVCHTPAVAGGMPYIVDGAAVWTDLAAQPEVLERLTAPASVRFAPDRWGSILTPTGDGRVVIRYRADGLEQVTRPVQEVLPVLQEAIARHRVEIPLAAGEGYLLDNHRMLHGRTAFAGVRRMYRVLGDPIPAAVLAAGFAPAVAGVMGGGSGVGICV